MLMIEDNDALRNIDNIRPPFFNTLSANPAKWP